MKVAVYKVKRKDTLEHIAKMYGVTTRQISPQKISEGDRVVINLESTKYYIVMPGDSLDSISQKLNIPKEEILAKNQIKSLFVGKHLII